LENELDSVNTIYFSPDRDIHNIAIESALTPKGQRISDCFDVHRLSSTREIVKINKNDNPKSVVLYGGLDYFADSSDIEAANKVNGIFDKGASYYAERAVVDDDRGTVVNLAGSGREVNSIATILPSEYYCQMFTGQLGTEESFKALSGGNYGIIHISTHGYYWSESTFDSQKNQNKIRVADKDLMTEEDKALVRSGLYFAGVNTTLSGEKIPIYLDDGILTAQEISELDLRGTEIVVLSACQTGLGDLKNDGVFGLQRGFKKAGVKSILMSLWKVDDNATELLMVEFYRNYLSGMDKTQSLRNAQKHVREYTDFQGNKIYENPYYWAGFVLLDALN
jgi:CHAT domain-containing protein